MTGLALAHGRILILENLRVPIAVISAGLFPALSLLFFVVPFGFGDDAVAATTAVVQLVVFAVMNSFLFTFGVGVANDRELAWDPYLRTLPADAGPRIAGRLMTGAAFAVVAVVPVVAVGALLTSATAGPAQLAAGLVALVVAGLPFLLGGLAVGYSLPVKAALPVTQLIFFPIAFGGGLFLPPEVFPGWLQAASTVLPSRGARDLVVWAVVGTPPGTVALAALAAWIAVTAVLARWAYRRDEGRRFH
ncbi:MAG TPA: ABC transporter permease [Pseudonocardia sp.]|nr:ABC transporter permease [Pseudonocardia sp.]